MNAHDPCDAQASRRRFLGSTIGLALAASMPAAFAATTPPAGTRARGSARIDVREHGAKGDGGSDDTSAFQRAIDALPADGGTVLVPAGAYVLDPTRNVRLRSRMHLSMAADARLLAKANALPQAWLLLAQQVQDLEISGGRIIGDRDAHLGTTGEWGHGIRIRGCSRVTVRDIHISRCWGDGISAGGMMFKGGGSEPGRDLLLVNVTCTGNRRQGLTLGSYRRVRVRRCEFSGTGGTPPGAGIDVEPDTGTTADVVIEDCMIHGNRGPGVQLYRRAAGVTIRRCVIEGNRGNGILVVSAQGCVLSDNTIRNNRLKGVRLQGAPRDIRLAGNRLHGNAAAAGGK